jgi:hypothetical protein
MKKKKKIKIESTKPSPDFAGGSHKLNALAKHQGFVKPKLAKKLTKIEKWIKKRNLGELSSKS